jgi:adenylate cyclase
VTSARFHDVLQRYTDAALAAAAFLVVAILAASLPAWNALERRVFDLLTVATATGELTQPIVLVAINEESFNMLKLRWPWPRKLHAQLVDRLAQGGAAVIALDMIFAEPSTPEDDRALQEAIARAGNVVLAADYAYGETSGVRLWTRTDPLPAFLDAGALAGLVTIAFDPDQFVRRIPSEPDAFWRQVVKLVQVKAPSLPVPPLPDEGAMIRYPGPDSVFDPIPYHMVLEASPEELKTAFGGRIVIVGRDLRATPELGLAQADLFATPFLAYAGGLTSGIKLHATILENALSGAAIRPLGRAGNIALDALAALAAFFALRRWRPIGGAVAIIVLTGGIAGLAWYAFVHQRTWIAVAAPVAVTLIAYLEYGAKAYLGETRRKREIQQAFSMYVSPHVVDQIVADPRRLSLGGERREITVMFTDLQGFTKLTEKTAPDIVSQVLIKHFTAMTDVILEKQGTVVQFIGDAIMAFWGAPIDDPDHALHAVEAAIAMQEGMEALREELRAEGLPEIYMRIGINTCDAVVGNMGSKTRFAYTAMGDGVNLASRLEGANKFYGTYVLVSGETVARLGSRIPMRPVDRVKVSGKTEAVDIFTPVRDVELAERTATAFAAYLRRDWDEAAHLYGGLGDPGDGVMARLLERIEACRRDPARASPDGSVALEKL